MFGTSDATRVAWLSVFQRPPVFAGIAGGTTVIVNGPSSSGKSSVLNELRSRNSVIEAGSIADEALLAINVNDESPLR